MVLNLRVLLQEIIIVYEDVEEIHVIQNSIRRHGFNVCGVKPSDYFTGELIYCHMNFICKENTYIIMDRKD
jgi:hypothetical protein